VARRENISRKAAKDAKKISIKLFALFAALREMEKLTAGKPRQVGA